MPVLPADDSSIGPTQGTELLARPEVVLVHLRSVGYGCYNSCVRAYGGRQAVKGGGS
jgi:Protein of unknown function (DUF1203)